MPQEIRSNKLLQVLTITKLLGNTTPGLPSGVTGFVRIKGFPTATAILKLLPKAGYTWYSFLTDENGEAITDLPGGYTIETIS